MPVIENLQEELREVKTLKLISNSLAEVSAVKIKSIRRSFEMNRLFFEEISELYHSIKLSRSIQILRQLKKEQKPSHQSNNVYVALTSNQHFYGTLNYEVINKFFAETKNVKGDRIVIGKTGKEHLENLAGSGSFITIVYKNDAPEEVEMKEFIERIQLYDRIFVYYPKFISILSQKTDVVDITHSPVEIVSAQKEIGYIFEPELPKLVEFFETQVKYLLFARVILETELSKTAARLIAMSRAEEKADELIKENRLQLAKAYKSLINIRLVETFSGIKKWGRN